MLDTLLYRVPAVKPFPLDFRGCLVRKEAGGEVTITLGSRLVEYFRGTPAEIAGLLEEMALKARLEDHRPTIRPFIGQDVGEWERSGDGPCEEYKKLLRQRAALIAAM
jgi:hypothetical protein